MFCFVLALLSAINLFVAGGGPCSGQIAHIIQVYLIRSDHPIIRYLYACMCLYVLFFVPLLQIKDRGFSEASVSYITHLFVRALFCRTYPKLVTLTLHFEHLYC